MNATQNNVLITPEMAKIMLEKNIDTNRRVKWGWVTELARAIKLGKFPNAHQPILFDVDGNLVDGQHRLLACISANLPIIQDVTYNVDKDAMFYIDTGKKRSTHDRAVITGKYDDNPVFRDPKTTSFVKKLLRLEFNRNHGIDAEYDLLVEAFPTEIECVAKQVMKKSTGSSNANINAACLAAAIWGESLDDIEKFYNVFLRGDENGCFGLNPSAAYNLYRTVMQAKLRKMTFSETKLYSMTQNALWQFCRGDRRVRIIRETKETRYPVVEKLKAVIEAAELKEAKR